MRLKLEKPPEGDDARILSGGRRLTATTTRPSGTCRLPELKSAQPFFATVDLGETKRLLVLDATDGADAPYDRLIVDTDGDKNLSGEAALTGKVDTKGPYATVRFPGMDTEIKVGRKTVPYHFRIVLYDTRNSPTGLRRSTLEENIYVMLISNCCYAGTVTLGKRQFRTVLTDANANGVFGEKRAQPSSDSEEGGGLDSPVTVSFCSAPTRRHPERTDGLSGSIWSPAAERTRSPST